MKTLLLIDSSARVTRSITRHLTARFAAGWRSRRPEGEILVRDVGLRPPPPIDEPWIAAAFGAEAGNAPALALSEALIAELERADAVVLGVPIYNFGMPASLKAYFDQIVRAGRTFAFDATAAEPYRPLLRDKPVLAVVSAGDGAIHPGGPLERMNHLEPHLRTLLGFIGLNNLSFVRAGYDEFQDDRAKRSLARAEALVEETLARWLPG